MTKKRTIPEKRGPSKKKVYDLKENGKNATGRPVEYDPAFCDKLVEFFSGEPMNITVTDKGIIKSANKLPTFENFAASISVSTKTLYNWSEQFPEFLQAFARARELQKNWLIENGLNGTYNPQFTIFVAKNITDMRDKQELDHQINVKSDLSTLTTEELIKRAEALKKIENNG